MIIDRSLRGCSFSMRMDSSFENSFPGQMERLSGALSWEAFGGHNEAENKGGLDKRKGQRKMKKRIQRIANKMGYHISRIQKENPNSAAYNELRNLCSKVSAPIIFDVGAHHGKVSRAFRELFPTGTVYAFEPFMESYDKLRANTEADPNIHAYNFGLSDFCGYSAFHANVSSATNSILPTDKAGAKTWGEGVLETESIVHAEFKTLDRVKAELKLDAITLLKLDVQGAEHLVMKGAVEACRLGLIDVIYAEIIIQPTYENQMRFDQSLGCYYSKGFDLYNIHNLNHTSDGRLRQMDVVFTRNVTDRSDREAVNC